MVGTGWILSKSGNVMAAEATQRPAAVSSNHIFGAGTTLPPLATQSFSVVFISP